MLQKCSIMPAYATMLSKSIMLRNYASRICQGLPSSNNNNILVYNTLKDKWHSHNDPISSPQHRFQFVIVISEHTLSDNTQYSVDTKMLHESTNQYIVPCLWSRGDIVTLTIMLRKITVVYSMIKAGLPALLL